MDTPSTRAEFEERLNYAREHLNNGIMQFAKGLRGPDSLLKVRYLPNGRIDFLSVDEMARLTANQTYQMRNMDFGEMLLDDKGR
ncbi:AVAST type 1 anti-phage system protein Avs1c [Janthinobacterium sp. MDT1-19]|uniref:AVAST type 1 anti-phage system protein Avs1c n=1 Tax=Janthinobacterium sp. MDT1-19 TaxID=1259339 RepID=UPI003F275B71